ncbi:MAG: dethiobiotin synthase [Hyphomonadaceae bacterium]
MSVYFVTGAGTDIGKTYVSCALLRAWRVAGRSCAALKPVITGYAPEAMAGSDSALLLEAAGQGPTEAAIAEISPWRFKAPLAAPLAARAEGRTIDFSAIAAYCRAQAERATGPLLVEGAGGVMSPLAEGETCLDLARALGRPAIFVAGSYLGAVSHALTGLAVLDAAGVPIAALVLSESQENIGLEETREMIVRLRPDVRIWLAPRGEPAAWATDLAARLEA